MRRFRFLLLLVLLATLPLVYATVGQELHKPSVGQESSGFSFEVVLEGLESGDVARLTLRPVGAETAAAVQGRSAKLPEVTVQNGRFTLQAVDAPDGFYELVVDAAPAYLRDPMGYLFTVSGGQLVWAYGAPRPLSFHLTPPSSPEYLLPCRLYEPPEALPPIPALGDMFTQEEAGESVCHEEPLAAISVSLGPGHGLSQEDFGTLGAGYHYAGPKVRYDVQGVWGRSWVTDPGVAHGVPGEEFVCVRVYVSNTSLNLHMEAGWIETTQGGLGNDQFVYVFDSSDHLLRVYPAYDLSPATAVETRLKRVSGTNWSASLYWGGSWRPLRTASIGMSTASWAYNQGEAYTPDATHPTLPVTTVDKGFLYHGGYWRTWNDRYSTTEIVEVPPYRCNMITQYHNFRVYSE